MGTGGKEFDVKVRPKFYEIAKRKKTYRYMALYQLWRIAENTEEIKKLLKQKEEPSDLIDAIERYYPEFIDDLTVHLTGKKATHVTGDYSTGGNNDSKVKEKSENK